MKKLLFIFLFSFVALFAMQEETVSEEQMSFFFPEIPIEILNSLPSTWQYEDFQEIMQPNPLSLQQEKSTDEKQEVFDAIAIVANTSSTPSSTPLQKNTSSRKKHQCTQCDKAFKRISHLQEHIRTHSGDRPYKCPWDGCTQSFKQSSHLKQHEIIHTGKKPFVCTFCTKAFTHSTTFKRHEITHTKKRPYKCPWNGCIQSFKQLSTLNNHIITHTKERSFECTWNGCNKAFFRFSHLEQHQITHTGEKPFKCTWQNCNKNFTRLSHMKKHMKNIHKKTP